MEYARPRDNTDVINGGRFRRPGRAKNIVSRETDQKTFIENVGVFRGRLSRTS